MKNPPAFPNLAPNSCGPHIDKRDGMTLRDWFAGQALTGMFAAGGTLDINGSQIGINRALTAYAVADAMLAARSTTPE